MPINSTHMGYILPKCDELGGHKFPEVVSHHKVSLMLFRFNLNINSTVRIFLFSGLFTEGIPLIKNNSHSPPIQRDKRLIMFTFYTSHLDYKKISQFIIVLRFRPYKSVIK